MSDELRRVAAGIRVVATDIDGVWTDAKMYYGPNGECMKAFSTYDGMATALLASVGIPTVILTSENTPIVARRAEKLGLQHVHMGIEDKLSCLTDIASALGVELTEIAYIGDDRNDIALLEAVGLSALVPNSPILDRIEVDIVTERAGGDGAFREFAEFILACRSEATA